MFAQRFRKGKSVTYKQQDAWIADVTDSKLLIRWSTGDKTTKKAIVEKWVLKRMAVI